MSADNQEGLYMMKWTGRQALKLGVGAALGIMSMGALAAMMPLDSDQLSSVTGEGTGVQISLSTQINGTMTPGATPTWTPGSGCVGATGLPGTNAKFCRFGLVENNNYNWLLLKDFNGFVDIPQLIVFGASANTVAYPSGQSVIGFQINLPSAGNTASQININNLSATFAMAVNTGCYSNSGGALVTSGNCTSASYRGSTLEALNNQNTYYDMSVFQTNSALANYSVVDAGKETGIMTYRISGNLNVGGTIYAFAK